MAPIKGSKVVGSSKIENGFLIYRVGLNFRPSKI